MAIAAPFASAQGAPSPDTADAVTASEAYVPTLTFDVASIRESPVADSYSVSGSFWPHTSDFRATNLNIRNLLAMAYGIRWDQMSGLPDWRAMFNIQAKSDSDTDQHLAKLSKAQETLEQRHMLQTLLADRFNLKVHWETREGPTYNLVVSKHGPKMKEATGGPPSPEEIKVWGDKPIPALYQKGNSQAGFDFIAHACSMRDIAEMLAGQFGRPVSDKTGLTGKYDFTLRYRGTHVTDRSAEDMNSAQPLDIAIQEQLGLKLLPAKGPVQILVVDHIEKPSKN